MQTWMIYAILSMIFAGITSILAKYGLQNVSADLGLFVRTIVIFLIIILINSVGNKFKEFSQLTTVQIVLLVASGVATTLSWLFYYRAMKEGPVSYVAAIDKASILVTLLPSFTLLKEPASPKILIGAGLIFIGLVVLVWK
ncbi:MAG: EamA family transporter [Chryseolinea sp.]